MSCAALAAIVDQHAVPGTVQHGITDDGELLTSFATWNGHAITAITRGDTFHVAAVISTSTGALLGTIADLEHLHTIATPRTPNKENHR